MNFFYTAVVMLFFVFNSAARAVETSPVKTGRFGGDGYNAPQLILHEDHTFEYRFFPKADPSDAITGTWSAADHKLILESAGNEKFMRRYRIVGEGACIKARWRMAFYRLCNC